MQRSKSSTSRALPLPCSHLQEAICPQKEQQVILALARNLEVCLRSKCVWRYFLDYDISERNSILLTLPLEHHTGDNLAWWSPNGQHSRTSSGGLYAQKSASNLSWYIGYYFCETISLTFDYTKLTLGQKSQMYFLMAWADLTWVPIPFAPPVTILEHWPH